MSLVCCRVREDPFGSSSVPRTRDFSLGSMNRRIEGFQLRIQWHTRIFRQVPELWVGMSTVIAS